MKIKKQNKQNKWVALVHWLAPLRRIGTSPLNSFLFFINQQVGLYYIKKYADLILAVSEHTRNQLIKIEFPQNKVFSVSCGVNYKKIQEIAKKINKKEYDAIFMKRFDGTKGVFDIIEIWKEVVKVKREAKLGMIGLGTKETMLKLEKMINDYNLKENIDILGPIYDFNKKFSILAKSKLFVLPSYEENWGIVIGEAMACGIPVICYDLPEIRSIWQNNVVWVPKGNKKIFTNTVIHLLDNVKERENLSKKGKRFIKKYDWEKIAEKELKLISDKI
jgi:glycosyltransferase involved in cell wall biosynthesis